MKATLLKNRVFWLVLGVIIGNVWRLMPSSPLQTYVYYDIINGTLVTVEEVFGIERSRAVHKSDMTRIVEKYQLEGPPRLMLVGHQGANYFGKFNFDSYISKGYFFDLQTILMEDPNDDPTTIILEARRLLWNKDGDYLLLPLLHELRPNDKTYTLPFSGPLDDYSSTSTIDQSMI